MAEIRVTINVDIMQANGDVTHLSRTEQHRGGGDNPIFFEQYVGETLGSLSSKVHGAIESQFGRSAT